jgi:hypothetical protein
MTAGASTKRDEFTSGPSRVAGEGVGALVFLPITSLLTMRLNKGADLSDESNYSLYFDDSLKGGIGSSTYLVFHQAAA